MPRTDPAQLRQLRKARGGPGRAGRRVPLDVDQGRPRLGKAGLPRPGNAGANTAADHIALLALALEQLPGEVVTDAEIIVRTGSAAATQAFTDDLADANLRLSWAPAGPTARA